MKIKVTVTKGDIEQGRRCDPDCCPIGRALARAGVTHYGVVGASVIVPDERQFAIALRLPQKVADWILDFDGRRPVEPFTFELAVPAQKKAKERSSRPVRRKPAPKPALAAAA